MSEGFQLFLCGLFCFFVGVFTGRSFHPWKATKVPWGPDNNILSLAHHAAREWNNTWFGIRILQFPSDLLTYQNLIYETNPDFVIETGAYEGGLSVYLAGILENLGSQGKVITVDPRSESWQRTLSYKKFKDTLLERILFIQGNSTSSEVFQLISKFVEGKKVLVILDSRHDRDFVLEELRLYSKLINLGSFLLVNDTHLGHAFAPPPLGIQPGPLAAVQDFLAENPHFLRMEGKQRFMISCLHSGILQRIE